MNLYKLQFILCLLLAIYLSSARNPWKSLMNILGIKTRRSTQKHLPSTANVHYQQSQVAQSTHVVVPTETAHLTVMEGSTSQTPDPLPPEEPAQLPSKRYKLKEEKFIMGIKPHDLAYKNAHVAKMVCFNFLIHCMDILVASDIILELQEIVEDIKNINTPVSYKEQERGDYQIAYDELKTKFIEKFTLFTSASPKGRRVYFLQGLLAGNPIVLEILSSDDSTMKWLERHVYVSEDSVQPSSGKSGNGQKKQTSSSVHIPSLATLGIVVDRFLEEIDQYFLKNYERMDSKYSDNQLWRRIKFGSNMMRISGRSTDASNPKVINKSYINGILILKSASHDELHRIRYHLLHEASRLDENFHSVSREEIKEKFLPVFGIVFKHLPALFFLHSANYWSSFLHVVFQAVNVSTKHIKASAAIFIDHVAHCTGVVVDAEQEDFKSIIETFNNVKIVNVDDEGREEQIGYDHVRYLHILIKIKILIEAMLWKIANKANASTRAANCPGDWILGNSPVMKQFLDNDVLNKLRAIGT